MNDPFKFGEAVTGEYLTNRRKEIKDIKEYIKSPQTNTKIIQGMAEFPYLLGQWSMYCLHKKAGEQTICPAKIMGCF